MRYENLPEYPMTTYGEDNKRIRKRVQRIRLPHFTSVDWTEQNPLLQKGEIAVESDTRRMKIGDGVTRWNDLEYIAGSAGGANVAWGEISGTLSQQDDLQNALDEKINKTQGTENAGKVLLVGDDGEVTLGEVSGGGSGGGLTEVAHDTTLTGKGTTASPLKLSSTIQNSISAKASTTYVDNQIAAVVTGYENADQQIKSSITNLSGTVSTLRTDHDDLGDQVSGIEGKIPATASESNQLATAQDLTTGLFDLKVEIAGDISDATSPIQTQVEGISAEVARKQDKLTAGANITIVDNVISATGGGGGGEGGITSVTHNESLTGMGTATSPLGIDTTYLETAISTNAVVTDAKSTADEAYETAQGKQDLLDETSALRVFSVDADTIVAETIGASTSIETPELTVGTDEGTLNLSIAAGTATIATNNGLDIVAQTKFDTAPTTDDTTAWADVNATALVTKAQVTTALGTVSGGGSLPDQTDNAGKFLMTDGENASWSDKPLVNRATGYGATAVGEWAWASTDTYATSFGGNSVARGNWTTALGYTARATAKGSTAVGYNAVTTAESAIQLGYGTNSDANTLKVGNENGNFELMSADGTIPAERMSSTVGTTGQVLTKTDTGMEWQDSAGGATGDYLPLSGGTLTGDLSFDVDKQIIFYSSVGAAFIKNGGPGKGLQIGYIYDGINFVPNFDFSVARSVGINFSPAYGKSATLGNIGHVWSNIFTAKINNGADIAVPTEGGTLARVEDIDAAVGDISSVLDSINGETLEG